MEQEQLLQTVGISKRFPGVQALKDVDFDLNPAEVHAVVGENGAGKTTLMNILSGVIQQDEGKILIRGEEQRFRHPLDAAKAGIGIVFQELSLVQNLSIAENIFVGRQKTGFTGLIDFEELYERSRTLLGTFGEDIDPRTPVKRLSMAKQQVVEILKALSHDPEILILDEPTSSLTHYEIRSLFDILDRLRSKGIAIVYISHHLKEIFDIADRATVLRDGKYIATVSLTDTDEQEIVKLMVGREVTHDHIERDDRINMEKCVLQVRNLSHEKYFRDISFDVHEGEIVSLAGLIGAGRSEMARTIFGMEKRIGGKIYLDGEEIHARTPWEAMQAGIAFTSENRKYDGLFLEMSLAENYIAPRLKTFSKPPFGFLDKPRIRRSVEESIRRLNIRTSSPKVPVRKLSGGNQQKVLLSMWLGIHPKVLIVDEPTKGVDVGAKNEIFAIIRDMADAGTAVIVISSELLEIIAISDRVLVFRAGEICAELDHREITEEKVVAWASGVGKDV